MQYVYQSTQANFMLISLIVSGMSHKTLRENMHPGEPRPDILGCYGLESHPHLCPDTYAHAE